MNPPRRLEHLLIALLSLVVTPRAFADSIVWFTPAAAKITGQGVFTPAGIPEAVRVSHPGGAQPQFGSLSIPLTAASDGVLDSILVCYKTVFQDPTPSSINGITLRTVTVPTSSTTVLSNGISRTSTVGQCDAIDVADQALLGAPTLSIAYTLGQSGTYVEIGAIGLRFRSQTVSVIDMPRDAVGLAPGRPNPFLAATRIEYRVSQAGPVELRVYDVAGRAVRSLFRGTLGPGAHVANWDGHDELGRAVPHGVASERIIRLR
jgi:hypothetical protein